MKYEIVKNEAKTIVGITAETANDDPNMGVMIGGLWQKFFGEGIYAALKKTSPFSLGVYSDYENQEKGKYNITVACEADTAVLPEGTVVRTIPAGRYAKFTVRGNQVEVVGAFWSELWKMDLPRAFTYDYEEYCGSNPDDCEINIYISLKEVESRCGLLCSECSYREQTDCKGCVNIDKPFWGESCGVMNCCRSKKHEHCGDCTEFPCDMLNGFAYDPQQGDDGKRLEQCRVWTGKNK